MDRAIELAITRPGPVWLTKQEVDLDYDSAVVPSTPRHVVYA